MIGKGREHRGESKKSRERERRKTDERRCGYRELQYNYCITFIIVIIIMPLLTTFTAFTSTFLSFSPISPLFLPLPSFHSFIIFMSEV